nr:MAG TPA: hypothetical protein [Caudoviricetes sp.]
MLLNFGPICEKRCRALYKYWYSVALLQKKFRIYAKIATNLKNINFLLKVKIFLKNKAGPFQAR